MASEHLSFDKSLPGGGILGYSDRNVLTKNGLSPSKWELPDFFKDVQISYHGEDSKYGWKESYFQSALKGQEFVIEEHTKAEAWAKSLITESFE